MKTTKYLKMFMLLIVCGMMAVCTSCKKDDDSSSENGGGGGYTGDLLYNPGKKISKIYFKEENSSSKELLQEWTWNGDKLVKIKIKQDYWPNVEICYSISYSGNQITSITSNPLHVDINVLKATYSYQNNLISKINYHATYVEEGKEDILATYFYNANQKVEKVNIIYYFDDGYTDDEEIILQYTGDNLTSSSHYYGVDEYEFDNNNNPYYNFPIHDFIIDDGEPSFLSDIVVLPNIFSKNNCVKICDESNHIYSYTYDEDGWPTMVVYNMGNKEYVLYYEYLN